MTVTYDVLIKLYGGTKVSYRYRASEKTMQKILDVLQAEQVQ